MDSCLGRLLIAILIFILLLVAIFFTCFSPRSISREKPVMMGPVEEAWAIKHDKITDMELDDEGNVYITGTVTAKYDTNDKRFWSVPFKGEGYISSRPGIGRDLTIDLAGNVYVIRNNKINKYIGVSP